MMVEVVVGVGNEFDLDFEKEVELEFKSINVNEFNFIGKVLLFFNNIDWIFKFVFVMGFLD